MHADYIANPLYGNNILALCGGAAIFHDLLTQGRGLYFFSSPAGAKPANRFGGDLRVNF